MRICIFGADGRTGQEVVARALSMRYEVTACVYQKPDNEDLFTSTDVRIGDVMDESFVMSALEGSDAVVSVIGHIKGSDPYMQTKGIKNIIAGMKARGISRIVSLTGTGVRIDGDKPSLLDRLGNIFISMVDSERVQDGIAHFEALKTSGLDWTVFRVLKLSQSDDEVSEYRLTEHGLAENLTSRKKAAQVLVDLVTDNQYVGKAPVVSK
jgi:putative NADH-flavin reductase